MYICTYIFMYMCICICVYVYVYMYAYTYLPFSVCFQFSGFQRIHLICIHFQYSLITMVLPWQHLIWLLSDQSNFFTVLYRDINFSHKRCDILSLYVQIVLLQPSFPINLPGDTEQPHFTGVETKCSTRKSTWKLKPLLSKFLSKSLSYAQIRVSRTFQYNLQNIINISRPFYFLAVSL